MCANRHGRFLPDVYQHFVNTYPVRHDGILINIKPATNLLISQDVPLDDFFTRIIYHEEEHYGITSTHLQRMIYIDHTLVGSNNWKHINTNDLQLLRNPNTKLVRQLLEDRLLSVGETHQHLPVTAVTVNGIRPGLEVVKYVQETTGFTSYNSKILYAVQCNNMNIAQYLASVSPKTVKAPLYVNNMKYIPGYTPATVDDIDVVMQIYGSQSAKVIASLVIDGVQTYQYLIGKISPPYFESALWYQHEIALDNIDCVAVIYSQCSPNIQQQIMSLLTPSQRLRLKYYLSN